MLLISFIVLLLLVSLTTAQLLEWTPTDFTLKSKDYSYVFANFQNPACPYCQALQPDFEAVAATIQSKYPKVAVVSANCIENPQFLTQYGITGYPTLKWFDTTKDLAANQGETYSGSRSQSSLVQFVDQKLATAADPRARRATPEHPSGEVVSLTPDTFDELVIQSGNFAFVEFFAPWCGHCQKVRPIVEELAKVFSGVSKVLIAEVDASAHVELGTKYGVRGYPTFKLFVPGLKDPVDYVQNRDLQSFITFINGHAGTNQNKDDASDSILGVISSFDALVKKFMEAKDKAAAFSDMEKKMDETPGDSVKYYLAIMKKIISPGGDISYIISEINRLTSLLTQQAQISREQYIKIKMRLNILNVFKKFGVDAGHAEL